MAFAKLWVIAYRDLGRNRRRTLFTLIAVALGVGLLILLEGYIAGVWDGALQNAIRLQTGHVQVRNPEYEEQKVSLLWADLLENAGDTAARRRPARGKGRGAGAVGHRHPQHGQRLGRLKTLRHRPGFRSV